MTKDTIARQVPSPNLVKTMGFTTEEIQRRKDWLQFTEQDEKNLLELDKLASSFTDKVVEDLYTHFMKFDEPRQFFQDQDVLNRVKKLQKSYFARLTKGNYDSEYIEERLKIGSVHANIGLDVKWYLGAYSFFMQEAGKRMLETFKDDPKKGKDLFFSLKKLVYMDIGLAIDTYIFQRESTIHQQEEELRKLSTPVFQMREGLLILPIVGTIDAKRARQLTEQLLIFIRDRRAKVVVVDITGVPTVDSRVANHLLQTIDAARLMGATMIVTGLSPEVAQALVVVGVDLSRMFTMGDLEGGIAEAERLLGYVVKREEAKSI